MRIVLARCLDAVEEVGASENFKNMMDVPRSAPTKSSLAQSKSLSAEPQLIFRILRSSFPLLLSSLHFDTTKINRWTFITNCLVGHIYVPD